MMIQCSCPSDRRVIQGHSADPHVYGTKGGFVSIISPSGHTCDHAFAVSLVAQRRLMFIRGDLVLISSTFDLVLFGHGSRVFPPPCGGSMCPDRQEIDSTISPTSRSRGGLGTRPASTPEFAAELEWGCKKDQELAWCGKSLSLNETPI